MTTQTTVSTTAKPGIVDQVRGLTRPYWISNAMEMFERLAYYGLRTVLPVYMVLAVEVGGPQFDHIQKGVIYFWWAVVQSFVPIVSGGYADRYGYKRTVAVSIAVKVAGYLLMAFAMPIAAWTSAGASTGVPGHGAVFGWFMAGALLLALGTAVFKPGVQGIIGAELNERNGSLGWAIFYQLVNVGGFLGPILAGYMRVLDWTWVFVSCAAVVCLNYPLLLAFDEPRTEGRGTEGATFLQVLWRSASGILEPRLFAFLAIFSGFWAMFYQLFDLLPNFIVDWVDTTSVYQQLAVPFFGLFGGAPPVAWAGRVPQEFMISLNAGMISLFAFAVGYLTGFVRSMTAMIVGIVVSACGIVMLGASASGWVILAAIATFSVGEMLASPTKLRYFSSIAPPGKTGLYLGYTNATTGIGWALGAYVAGALYQEGGDKVVLARRHLVQELGVPAADVAALQKTDVLPALAERLGVDAAGATQVLWQAYAPQGIWMWFAAVGLVSMVGLGAFEVITRRGGRAEEPLLIGVTGLVTGICYGPLIGGYFAAVMATRALAGAPAAVALGLLGFASWVAGSMVLGMLGLG